MLLYISSFLASGLGAVLAALTGIFSGAAISNKSPDNPLAPGLMYGGIGLALLIAVLYTIGAFLRYKDFEPVWITYAFMFCGIPLMILFVAFVFSNLPQ